MSGTSNSLSLQCVERAFKFPVVDRVYETAFQAYRHFKASNRFLEFTLSITEKAGSFVVPVIIKTLENQIKAVDGAACRGLDHLETIFPEITLQPRQVLCRARYRYFETLDNYRNQMEVNRSHLENWTNCDVEKVADYAHKIFHCLSTQCFLCFLKVFLDELEIMISNPNFTVQNGEPERTQCILLLWTSIEKLYDVVKRLEMMVRVAISKITQKGADVWSYVEQHAVETYNRVVDIMQPIAHLLHLLPKALVKVIGTLLVMTSPPDNSTKRVLHHDMWYLVLQDHLVF